MIGAPDFVVIGLRALSFIAGFQAAGAVLFGAIFESRLPPAAVQANRRLAGIVAAAAILLTISQHVIGPARMTGDFADVFDASLQRFLFESGAGTAPAPKRGVGPVPAAARLRHVPVGRPLAL